MPEESEISRDSAPTLRLRLLATSDLHMQLLDFDYTRDQHSEGGSLAKLAGLIAQARKDADLCLLLDNGDTLQGTPMGDLLAKSANGSVHPMAQAMNLLGYDAIGLGNHDFDFGLNALRGVLEQYEAPVVCSNFQSEETASVQPSVLIERTIRRGSETLPPVRIGITGAVPSMTGNWNRHHLANRAQFGPALPALKRAARDLQDRGADLVIALAHMGITLGDEGNDPQNQVIDVAGLDEVHVVIGGHTHLRFPGPDHAGTEGVDCDTGLIAGTPAVQPGTMGSDLGQIDLDLSYDGTGWHIASTRVALRSALPQSPEEPAIASIAAPAHMATRDHLQEPVSRIHSAIHTYFALATPSPVIALMAAAQVHAARSALDDNTLAGLPVIAAASSPATGGYDGPQNFIALEPGTLLRRHVAGLNRYANQVWAVRTNGARIKDWLERASLIYNLLGPEQPDQFLVNAKIAGFRYDTIFGLEYKIDPTRPAAFDMAGRRIPGAQGRVSDIRWQGAPVDPAQEFIVATTDHRVGGGGAHPPFEDHEIVLRGSMPIEAALLSYLDTPDAEKEWRERPWRFRDNLGVSAILKTSPCAAEYIDEIEHLAPDVLGIMRDGFLHIRVHL
jgi:2',3'-cyclic-nucleotide 2'-phosphodiesterase/3'-nucleotidase